MRQPKKGHAKVYIRGQFYMRFSFQAYRVPSVDADIIGVF